MNGSGGGNNKGQRTNNNTHKSGETKAPSLPSLEPARLHRPLAETEPHSTPQVRAPRLRQRPKRARGPLSHAWNGVKGTTPIATHHMETVAVQCRKMHQPKCSQKDFCNKQGVLSPNVCGPSLSWSSGKSGRNDRLDTSSANTHQNSPELLHGMVLPSLFTCFFTSSLSTRFNHSHPFPSLTFLLSSFILISFHSSRIPLVSFPFQHQPTKKKKKKNTPRVHMPKTEFIHH